MSCEFSLNQLAVAVEGEILSGAKNQFRGVGTDTRHSLQGQIFIALAGDKFDAHQFLSQAVEKGAHCLVVHKDVPEIASLKKSVSIVKVKNTLVALQALAKAWRRTLKGKVVGITGSNGKTSTKEFAASILAKKFKVHYSKKSFNNHWGVPMTLLDAPKDSEVIICEIGMNHSGEITNLSKISLPDIVLCTMVGRAHIGNFDGKIQLVANAKEEIYLANPKAVKIFNCDNEYTMKMFDRVSKLQGTEKTIVFSSFSAGAEVSLRGTHIGLDGLQLTGHIGGVKSEAKIPVFGRQNVNNLMAAACIGLAMKMEPEVIWNAFGECRSEWGRNQIVKIPSGTTVLFDAYNANPDSMAALVRNLFEVNLPAEAKKVAVFGEMLELGKETTESHRALGEMVGNTDFEVVWFMGPSNAAFSEGFKKSSDKKTLIVSSAYEEVLAKKVSSMLNPSDVVVIKGSRGMRLEQVLKCWDPQFAAP